MIHICKYYYVVVLSAWVLAKRRQSRRLVVKMRSLTLPASYISKAHTICASAAFLSSLLIGSRLHYRKIVKNEVAGYPDEWWPSVSAT